MAERPILFSAPMVRAILAGTKTQTRRVVKPPHDMLLAGGATIDQLARVPFAAGETLWVRETWRTEEHPSGLADGIRFAADDAFVPIANTREAAELWSEAHENGRHGGKWRPSIFLRRWASRITLEVTGVTVERLQDISEKDARAEGLALGGLIKPGHAVGCFSRLWDEINGKRAPWASNPWVWVVSFRKVAAITAARGEKGGE